jgi:hypothetical protein
LRGYRVNRRQRIALGAMPGALEQRVWRGGGLNMCDEQGTCERF